MFARLGRWCYDRRRLVLVLWLAGLVGIGALSSVVGGNFRSDFSLPDTESKIGVDIIEAHFGGMGSGQGGTIVFRAEQGVQDPEVRVAMEAMFDEVRAIEDVNGVVSPYSPEGAMQVSMQGPEAGLVAYASLEVPQDTDIARTAELGEQIRDAKPEIDGLEVELGGFIFAPFDEPSTEAIGLAFAVIILIVAFGSVLAMGLPVGVALFGIGIGTALVTLVSQVVVMPDFTTFLGVMIGLGVGIDYALLIVTRYREQLHHGHEPRAAVAIAIDTAGRSVLFAGTTVVISLLGMLLMRVGFVQGLGTGAAVVVAVTVVASLTLLPALLGFAGHRIEVTRYRGLVAAGLVAIALLGLGLKITPLAVALPVAAVVLIAGFWVPALKREVPHRAQRPLQETLAYRWSRVIQHRPWIATIGAAVGLLVLALPTLGIHLAFADEGNFPEDTDTRQAYDLLVAGFGPGFNGPLALVAEAPEGGADVAALAAVTEAVGADEGVAFVSPGVPSPDGEAVLWQLFANTSPQDRVTEATVARLRTEVLPSVEGQFGADINLTGSVAGSVDFSDFLRSRYPWFIGTVLVLSFLLLMVVFRSVLVPLKAVIMNLLSIAAAYGILVALFQWGWLSSITGVQPAPIEPWAPMMLFAIVFGLSMDYEVFLLSRVREEWHKPGGHKTSVANGLAATARVISAAAAIMVVVFGSFILESDRNIKLMGTGLAVAILIDATVVRMLLVPATMELLGDRNWWLPSWLDRILPNVDVEGHVDEIVVPAEEPAPTG